MSQQIVRCAIYPGIAFARLGNSDEYYFGPEVPGIRNHEQSYKDKQGRIKRMAARFRIYGYDAEGNVVRELTANSGVQIAWTVHLANKKAAWYDFDLALDIPDAAGIKSKRRNAEITGSDRRKLMIDPGPAMVTGASHPPVVLSVEAGATMWDEKITLGELFTDDQGRLILLGGLGQSSTYKKDEHGNPEQAYTFGNNDGWHDDTSDGPVSATVTIDGQEIPCDSAWVIVGPPDYAPGLEQPVTMYDIIHHASLQLYPGLAPTQISFVEHIFPIFKRFDDLQWVNAGFFQQFGYNGKQPFLSSSIFPAITSNDPLYLPYRQMIFGQFRNPDYLAMEPEALPPIYGDGMNRYGTTPRQWLTLTPTQYEWLRRWAEGDFVADWPEGRSPYDPPPFLAGVDVSNPPQRLEELPLSLQPAALDRATLDEGLGGAFHPGCEATWPMRVLTMYRAPFRLREALPGENTDDFGEVLTQASALAPGGPLTKSAPGDITRWMAVPWQTDTSSCRSGYAPTLNPYLPTFWPARVPNQVLTEATYEQLKKNTPVAERTQLFMSPEARADWLRDYQPDDYKIAINLFIKDWYKAGVVTPQEAPSDLAGRGKTPKRLYVETGNDMGQQGS